MDDMISRQALCEYALNQKDKSITPNDIMRFPSAQSETHEERTETHACDCISRQAAITAIQKAYADTEGGTDKCAVWKNVGLTNALHIMQDLPSAQPEQTDCEYCHEDSDGYVYPIEKNSHAVIFGSVLYLKAKGWRGEVQIKYCPMCGRRLER